MGGQEWVGRNFCLWLEAVLEPGWDGNLGLEFPIPGNSVKGKGLYIHMLGDSGTEEHTCTCMQSNVWRAGLFALLSTCVLLSGPYRMVSVRTQQW